MRTIFFYGEGERRIIQPAVRDARHLRFQRSEAVEIPGAGHRIGHDAYLEAVRARIADL